MNAYKDVFNHASTNSAPWYIIPDDNKWFTRLAGSDIICNRLKDLKLTHPTVSETQRQELLKAKERLENEDKPA